jgi:acylphosphatase
MVRYYILVQGHVQGVGFRFFVQMNATFLGLTGYVRNLDNGSVEFEVQGKPNLVDKLIEIINIGNRFINIESLEKKEISIVPSEKKFFIK